jgi:hypothetical protein
MYSIERLENIKSVSDFMDYMLEPKNDNSYGRRNTKHILELHARELEPGVPDHILRMKIHDGFKRNGFSIRWNIQQKKGMTPWSKYWWPDKVVNDPKTISLDEYVNHVSTWLLSQQYKTFHTDIIIESAFDAYPGVPDHELRAMLHRSLQREGWMLDWQKLYTTEEKQDPEARPRCLGLKEWKLKIGE